MGPGLKNPLEPQCCDGSDELPGVCKNVCKEVGEEYRKKYQAEMKIRKTVSFWVYTRVLVSKQIV